jgi:hypothetical protein
MQRLLPRVPLRSTRGYPYYTPPGHEQIQFQSNSPACPPDPGTAEPDEFSPAELADYPGFKLFSTVSAFCAYCINPLFSPADAMAADDEKVTLDCKVRGRNMSDVCQKNFRSPRRAETGRLYFECDNV